MCGIFGVLTADVRGIQTIMEAASRAADTLRHRGPDDIGVEIIDRTSCTVIFGHSRLAIIDLSPAGHQPMFDPDRGNWITFNGEIYNYRDLRKELEQQGQVFRTQTDTEVILKAYAVWGPACVHRLRGIFGFGIWNKDSHVLFLARDQIGVKPLYYWLGNGSLLFASEVRALLASGLVPPRLDLRGLRSYLAYGSVQEPYTLVQGIYSLLPGHTLTWQDGHVRTQRYWQLPTPESVKREPPADLLDQVSHYLTEAVRVQLVADVPLGVFLSGGIDSTAITALMKRSASGPVKTFSIVFDGQAYDERVYSQTASRHIGTQHTELLLTGEVTRQALPQALAAFDQPSVDGLNTYFISKLVREAGLTVALSGVGGDELFGGYEGYRKTLMVESWGDRFRRLPRVARRFLSASIGTLPVDETWRKVVSLLQTKYHPYFTSRQVFDQAQVASLLWPEFLLSSGEWEPDRFSQLEVETAGYDPINRASALELQTYMLSTLLRDTDQMSMAHALEVRVPFLDHKLVEYLFTLPGTCKLMKGTPKPLLTRSLESVLPYQCVHRPKQGFELPFALWLRESLEGEIRTTLLDHSSSTILPFRPDGLAQLWHGFESGCLSWSRAWGVYVLIHWLSEHAISA